MQKIAAGFKQQTGHQIIASYGATGAFYVQIKNGAPFEVLLAADDIVPARLERENATVPGTRFTYAIGKLVLWSPQADFVDAHGQVLTKGMFRRVAIANPVTAPYGSAAVQTMKSIGLHDALLPKLVLGQNITQAFQFVLSGNAPLGFIAMSQVVEDGRLKSGSVWVVPPERYSPIRQGAVILEKGARNPVARQFANYLKGDSARSVIRSYGYDF